MNFVPVVVLGLVLIAVILYERSADTYVKPAHRLTSIKRGPVVTGTIALFLSGGTKCGFYRIHSRINRVGFESTGKVHEPEIHNGPGLKHCTESVPFMSGAAGRQTYIVFLTLSGKRVEWSGEYYFAEKTSPHWPDEERESSFTGMQRLG